MAYTVTFDLNALGDQLCGATKFCDCSATYTGWGVRTHQDEQRVTFQGNWAVEKNTCHDSLTIWTPSDGKAFHTLLKKAGSIDAWVVHRAAAGHTKLSSGQKAGGQFWIDALRAPSVPLHNTQTDGSSIAMGVEIKTTHVLDIRDASKAQPKQE